MERIKITIIVAAIYLSFTCAAQTVISGRVFVDANQNELFDSQEKGLANVKITDGITFVISGADGSFSIKPHPDARFIYICTPSFYDPSGKFYRPLPIVGNADFGLIHRPNQSSTFIQTADNEEHIYRTWIDELKMYIRNESPAFVITTGDICYEPGLRMHAREFTTEKLGTRVLYSSGNHDLLTYGRYGEALFEELFGPCWYSFDVANTHFIVFPMLFGDNPTGFSAKQVFNWIKNDLDLVLPNQKVVICSHELFLREEKSIPMLVYRSDTLVLKDYPITGYIYGHRHNMIAQPLPGSSILTYGTGTANKGARDHSPAAYRLFTLQPDGSIRSQTRYSLQNALFHSHAANTSSYQHITVNAYHTPSDISAVSIEGTEKTISLQKNSDWSWSTPQKVKLSLEKPLQVTATTKNGSRFTTPLLLCNRLIWSLSLGGMTTIYPPLLVGDNVYVATYDDQMGRGNQILSIDAKDGTVLWRFYTTNAVKSSLAFDQGYLLFCDVTGKLYAVDANSGALSWERQMLSFSGTSFQQGVVVRHGTAYVCSGNTAAAVRILDGSILWNRQLSPFSNNTSASTVLYNNLLLSGTHWTSRYALNVENGELVWQQADKGLRNCEAAPAFNGNLLYYPGFENLVVVDPKDGAIVQSVTTSGSLSSASVPWVDEKLIVVGSSDRGIFAFSRDSLKQLWNFRTHAALTYTVAYTKDNQQSVEASPVVVHGSAYCGASDGYFYALDAQSGRFLWSYRAGAPILSAAIHHQGYLLFVDMAGNLYKLKE
jgi:outer membrane protein assembly factor BamB